MKEGDGAVLKVILAHVGTSDEFTAPAIINACSGLRAKQNPALVAGIGRLSSKSLGHVLKRCQGAVVDGQRLYFRLDRKRDRWIYWFEPPFQEAHGFMEHELEDRIQAADSLSRKALENSRELDKIDELEEQRKATEPGPALTITKADPMHSPPALEYEYSERWVNGQLVRTLVIDPRTGEPLKKRPVAEAPPPSEEYVPPSQRVEGSATPRIFAPWVGKNRNGDPVLKRQPTRAELAARHHQSEGPAYSGGGDWSTRGAITPIHSNWTKDL